MKSVATRNLIGQNSKRQGELICADQSRRAMVERIEHSIALVRV